MVDRAGTPEIPFRSLLSEEDEEDELWPEEEEGDETEMPRSVRGCGPEAEELESRTGSCG